MLLVFVFDGLRPDLVRPDLMPRLCRLRDEGTWFERSHCVFPTVTRVNAASLATGSYPATHGIPSNTLYLPADGVADPFQTTGDAAVLQRLRAAPDAPLLDVPTTAEALAAAGMGTVAVGTGSPGSAHLLNPEATRCGGATFHYAYCDPEQLRSQVEERLGPHAGAARSETVENLVARVEYAATALGDVLVPVRRPALAYFWCTVPDALHHHFGFGSPEACEGLRRVDAVFGRLVERLEQVAGPPNVIVTADHGYATVEQTVDVAALLSEAAILGSAQNPCGFVTVDGGTGHLFFREQAAERSAAATAFLLQQPWVAAVLSRHEVPGALPLAGVDAENRRSADVTFCFAWRPGQNAHGWDGLSFGGGGLPVGAGDHGGGSPFELRNTLIAAGPAFRRGVSEYAAGIVDVAPTVCRVLGVQPSSAWNGRVLGEALLDSAKIEASAGTEIASVPGPKGLLSGLRRSATQGTRYVDQIGHAS
jgi:predicted AlkP superfamily pyrophosphatase or phosphodiesterase